MSLMDKHTQHIDKICSMSPVIPVLKLDNEEQALGICRALVQGGLPVLEITLRSAFALQAIETIRKELPEVVIGAGTVTNIEQYEASVVAGADFIVSPGSTTELLTHGQTASIPLLPGVGSVSETMSGMALGYERFKLFPAVVVGGLDMLKAFYGPLANLKFCPTGGVSPQNAPDFLQLPNVMCVGGTWITPKDLVKNKDWQGIELLAKTASQLGK